MSEHALCPGFRQALQSRALLAGGSSVSGVSVAVAMELEVVAVAVAKVVPVGRGVNELGGGGGGAGDGEQGDKPSSGADGRGHVTSLKFSGQNSRIFSYRYHCRLLERPAGGRTGGS